MPQPPRPLEIATARHARHAEQIRRNGHEYWSRCGVCDQHVQMGAYGLRAHTYLLHPGQKVLALPATLTKVPPWNRWKTNFSSPQSKPLTLVWSSTTADSPGTSARTD